MWAPLAPRSRAWRCAEGTSPEIDLTVTATNCDLALRLMAAVFPISRVVRFPFDGGHFRLIPETARWATCRRTLGLAGRCD